MEAQMAITVAENESIIEDYKSILGDEIAKVELPITTNFYKSVPEVEQLTDLQKIPIKTHLVDLNMGSGIQEGLKYIGTLKKMDPHSYIVVYSGNVDKTDILIECYKAGANNVIKKDSKNRAQKVLIEIVNLTISHFETYNACILSSEEYITEVVKITDSDVLVEIENFNVSEMWFSLNRFPSKPEIGNKYLLQDKIFSGGESKMSFRLIGNTLEKDEKEYNSIMEKLGNSTKFYNYDGQNNN